MTRNYSVRARSCFHRRRMFVLRGPVHTLPTRERDWLDMEEPAWLVRGGIEIVISDTAEIPTNHVPRNCNPLPADIWLLDHAGFAFDRDPLLGVGVVDNERDARIIDHESGPRRTLPR